MLESRWPVTENFVLAFVLLGSLCMDGGTPITPPGMLPIRICLVDLFAVVGLGALILTGLYDTFAEVYPVEAGSMLANSSAGWFDGFE